MLTSTRLRTSLAAPVVACTIGMKTPSTRTVTSTEASAAKLGTALRESERRASRRKKPIRILGLGVLVGEDGVEEVRRLGLGGAHGLGGRLAQQRAELGRREVAPRVAAGQPVADDAAALELDDAPAH